MNLNNYPDLELIHSKNKNLLSNLIFIEEEVKFLKLLLKKYFLNKIEDTFINRVQLIDRQLSQLNMIKANIIRDVLTHQGNLQSKINGLLDKSIDFLRLENDRIEEEIKDLNKCFKGIKKEIFALYKNFSSEESAKDIALA